MTSDSGQHDDPRALRAALRRDLVSAMKAREADGYDAVGQADAARRLRDQARLLAAYLS